MRRVLPTESKYSTPYCVVSRKRIPIHVPSLVRVVKYDRQMNQHSRLGKPFFSRRPHHVTAEASAEVEAEAEAEVEIGGEAFEAKDSLFSVWFLFVHL